ncbi:MAG: hypothetical protein HRU19_29085 [Pseudobacteriovorax sp.]|nr:hypothetical protein [Pseudobacteriovorax sp.]
MGVSPLVSELQELLVQYLKGHKNRSLSGISRKSGVSYSTVRRIYSGDTSEPSFTDTIVPIAGVILAETEFFVFLKKHCTSNALYSAIADQKKDP